MHLEVHGVRRPKNPTEIQQRAAGLRSERLDEIIPKAPLNCKNACFRNSADSIARHLQRRGRRFEPLTAHRTNVQGDTSFQSFAEFGSMTSSRCGTASGPRQDRGRIHSAFRNTYSSASESRTPLSVRSPLSLRGSRESGSKMNRTRSSPAPSLRPAMTPGG